MKLKVIVGGVRTDNGSFTVGQVFEADDEVAKSLLREKIVEVVEEKPADDVQVDAKPAEPEKPAKTDGETGEPVVEDVKPSMDWTAKEIREYGVSKGLEFEETATKKEMLAVIEGGEQK